MIGRKPQIGVSDYTVVDGERVYHCTEGATDFEVCPEGYEVEDWFSCDSCSRRICYCFGTDEDDVDRCCDCWSRDGAIIRDRQGRFAGRAEGWD